MTNFKCIESLEENPTQVYLEVSSILIKLVDNVLLYPSNPKYRKLRLENKLVSTVLIPSIGAMECLFELGFQEGDDALLLPPENTSAEKLKQFRTEIANRRNNYLKKNETEEKNSGGFSKENVERQSTPQPEATHQASIYTTKPSSTSSNSLLSKMHSVAAMVLQFEQESTRRKAITVVPLSDISECVQTRMRYLQKQALKDGQLINESSLQETLFVSELMHWFKNDFFKWVNSPKCSTCNCDTQFQGMSSDPKELIETERVEVYKCRQCNVRVLFPRITKAERLLATRRGRCGEWAIAFTALCRALGFEARYIWDMNDHVWTEVYMKSESRWVHCDPCECAIDKPLLYEKGWGKKLSYILAFACDHVQDVTWRYSANHSEVLTRRIHCSEQQLVQTIKELNQLRQGNLSEVRRKALIKRNVLELVQLMVPATESEGDTQGRQSGSLAWRLARSETTIAQAGYVWAPTLEEISAEKMVISYCTAKDEYRREVGGERMKDWHSGMSAAVNVFRKEEKDWEIAYLCRTENSVEGQVSWQVDLSGSGVTAGHIEIICPSTTFEDGKVVWQLCSGDKCVPVFNGQVTTEELKGSVALKLTATLSGGCGDVSWQHAQLFRQSLNTTDPAFMIKLKLNKS